MNHLTDEQIQEFLESQNKTSEILDHVKSCTYCKKQIEAYKQVFSSLNIEPVFSLPINFVDQVVSSMERSEDKKYKKWESVLLIFSILQGIGLAIYFLGFKKILNFFSFEPSTFFQTTIEQISGFGNGFFPILIFAVIVILFYGFLDRFIQQIKHQSS